MATKASRSAARLMISPAVLLLLGWMIVPLVMTVYFSFLRYNLLSPGATPFAGWENYYWFLTDPSFKAAVVNTLIMVGGTVGIAEHLGSDTFIHIHGVPGCDPMTVRAPGDVTVKHGDTVYLTPNATYIHKFDKQGLRIS